MYFIAFWCVWCGKYLQWSPGSGAGHNHNIPQKIGPRNWNTQYIRAVVLALILTLTALGSIDMVLLQSYLRSLKVIQPSSYLNDPTIIKPKNSTFYMNDSIKMTDVNTCLLQLYLISLSCIVEEYSTSRVMPQALRLCFISSRALLCWRLSICRKRQRQNSTRQKKKNGQTTCCHLSEKWLTSSCVVSRWTFFTLQGAFSSISQNRRKLYSWSRERVACLRHFYELNRTLCWDSNYW